MSEAVEVECRNQSCPGRTEAHSRDCICDGTGEVLVTDTVTVIEEAHEDLGVQIIGKAPTKPCPEKPLDVDVERWDATWYPATREDAGYWHSDICCPRCGEEGEPVE